MLIKVIGHVGKKLGACLCKFTVGMWKYKESLLSIAWHINSTKLVSPKCIPLSSKELGNKLGRSVWSSMFFRRSSYSSFHFSSDGKHTRVIYFSVWRLSSWINLKASFPTFILFYYCLFMITTKLLLHTVLHLAQTNLNAQISLEEYRDLHKLSLPPRCKYIDVSATRHVHLQGATNFIGVNNIY